MKIELENVCLQYDGKPPLFREINLVAQAGEFILIQGASGVGKSSLLRLLNRLQQATAGDILFDGKLSGKCETPPLRR